MHNETETRINTLEARQPDKAHGRQHFLKDLMAEAKSNLSPGSSLSQVHKTTIMKAHGSLRRQLDDDIKRDYARTAITSAEQAHESRSESIAHELSALCLSRRHHAMEEAQSNGFVFVRNCRLDSRVLMRCKQAGKHMIQLSKVSMICETRFYLDPSPHLLSSGQVSTAW